MKAALKAGAVFVALVWTVLMFSVVACVLFGAAMSTATALPLCNVTPCRIAGDLGGSVGEYTDLAARMVRTREPVEIAGDCYSSCTLFADLARPFVCVRASARMHFHQATIVGGDQAGLRFEVAYSDDIAAWIAGHGGQPTVGFLLMRHDDVLRFWPSCGKS